MFLIDMIVQSASGVIQYRLITLSMIDDNMSILKGLSHEIDFKNFDKNLQNLT